MYAGPWAGLVPKPSLSSLFVAAVLAAFMLAPQAIMVEWYMSVGTLAGLARNPAPLDIHLVDRHLPLESSSCYSQPMPYISATACSCR
jgi:hypothetical protein